MFAASIGLSICFWANRVVLAVGGRQIEPAWARQCVEDGQIEQAKASQSTQDSQIEPARASHRKWPLGVTRTIFAVGPGDPCKRLERLERLRRPRRQGERPRQPRRAALAAQAAQASDATQPAECMVEGAPPRRVTADVVDCQ